MSLPYRVRRGRPEDLDVVTEILDERILWLRNRGSEQWNTGRTFRNRMANAIAQGETWLLDDDSATIATVSISKSGDPDFWTPEELAESAIYMSKLATTIKRSGEGLGELLINWVRDRAARSGLDLVRWDVWRTNYDLQDYYTKMGAPLVRSVDIADRWSGALFAVPAIRSDDLSERIVEQEEV